MFIRLAKAWGGALPVAGGLIDQPLGVLLVGQTLAAYEEAWRADKEADRQRVAPPEWAAELVRKMRALSTLAAQRGD